MTPTLRVIAKVIVGPLVALLLSVAGCANPWHLVGVMCGHNFYISLALFTVIGWSLTVAALVALRLWRSSR